MNLNKSAEEILLERWPFAGSGQVFTKKEVIMMMERYVQFFLDQVSEGFEEWRENQNNSNCFKPLHDYQIEAWQAAKLSMVKESEEILGDDDSSAMEEKLMWAINTIRDRLLFGRDELGAALARELRAKGVMLDAVKTFRAMDKENEELKKENTKYESCLKFILEFKGPEYIKTVEGRTMSIFDAAKEALTMERIKAFHNGYTAIKDKYDQAVKDIEWLHRIVTYGVNSSRLDSKYSENLEEIRKRHGLDK